MNQDVVTNTYSICFISELDKRFYTNLTLHLVYELLQLVDLGAPVVVWLHADP